jgi:hypothetical protein
MEREKKGCSYEMDASRSLLVEVEERFLKLLRLVAVSLHQFIKTIFLALSYKCNALNAAGIVPSCLIIVSMRVLFFGKDTLLPKRTYH